MDKKEYRTKNEVLKQIQDLKVNSNALDMINRTLKNEKREWSDAGFYGKDISSKKHDILSLIRREDELLSLISTSMQSHEKGKLPLFTEDIGDKVIGKVILNLLDGKKNGIMVITSGGNYAEMGVEDGDILYATSNGLEGERALFNLLDYQDGKAEFFPLESVKRKRTIDKKTSKFVQDTLEQQGHQF